MKRLKQKSMSAAALFAWLTIIILFFPGAFAFAETQKPADKVKTEAVKPFPIRGFHIDLRIEVMTMPALKAFAKELAGMGINTLVMEWEASYPYEKHATISNKYAYTREQVKSFVAYCDSLGYRCHPAAAMFRACGIHFTACAIQ